MDSRLRCLLAIALVSAQGLLASPASAERRTVQVAPGDRLGAIAQRYGVSVDELRSWNHLESDRILAGQELVVSDEPETPAPPPARRSAPDPAPAERARDAAPEGGDEPTTTYVVLPGDGLGKVAALLGTTVASLRETNPTIRPDRLRPGQVLRVAGATRILDHEVRRGDSLSRIASRYEVRVRDLQRWNPEVRRRGLLAGSTIRVYTDVRLSRSESIGAVNDGRLEHSETLPAHPAFEIRDAGRAHATHETVSWMLEAFDALHDADPRAPRVRVHDLSLPRGGPIADHRSHQSGRDADVAYYRRACRRSSVCYFHPTRPQDLDVARQWRLFRTWLAAGVVDAIFVDYPLEEVLYEEARRQGASRDELERWFQYPRGPGHPAGVIRHFRNHADHFHVRFRCPDGDDECAARPELTD